MDELLHALAEGSIVGGELLLGGDVGELRLRDLMRIGGDVGGGHWGTMAGDATESRVAQIS